MKTRTAVLIGGLVVAALMKAEQESPGATGRGAQELRQAVTPALAATVGAASDAVLVAREEIGRQGINPAAILSTPTTAGLGAPPDSPAGIPSQGAKP